MERLNKYLAHAGVGSRRRCDELIAAGRVKINGQVVTDLGLRVDPERQKVTVDDAPARPEKPVYWAVHKPPGYLSTNSDPGDRPRVIDLLPHVDQRVYTVGRLDEASEGLVVMTNDGELAFAVTHPKYGVDKTYHALVAGRPSPDDLKQLVAGVWLSDGKARARDVRRLKPHGDSTWLRVVLAEGKNREVRRMLARLGHKVLKLKRVAIGPVKLDRLPRGKARKLRPDEVDGLRAAADAGKKRAEHKRRQATSGATSPKSQGSNPDPAGGGRQRPERPTGGAARPVTRGADAPRPPDRRRARPPAG